MIFEIRNYHFNPDLLDAYKNWATGEAIPFLSKQVDVLGFWVTTNDDPEVHGQALDDLGTANVTWIIRWRDLAQRNEEWPSVISSPEWSDIFSRVPGGLVSYLRIESKFAKSLM